MSTVNINGVLRDPAGQVSPNTPIRITTVIGYGDTLASAIANVVTDGVGAYAFDIVFGTHKIEVRFGDKYTTLGTAVVSDGAISGSISDLLEYTTPMLPEYIVTMLESVSEVRTTAALVEAEVSGVTASALAASEDRTQTGLDRVSTTASALAASEDRTQTGLDRVSTTASATVVTDTAVQVEADRVAVELIFDQFDDIYLGSKPSDPSLDNDGNPLKAGAVYWNTTVSSLKFYNGTEWEDPDTSATNSATSALNSKVAAALSEINAAASATNAELSAVSATNSASDATTSANNADSSAVSAANSAGDAEASASESTAQAVIAASYGQDAYSDGGSVDLSGGSFPAKPDVATLWVISLGGTVDGTLYVAEETLAYSKTADLYYRLKTVAGATWGGISGSIDNQFDLVGLVNTAESNANTYTDNETANKADTTTVNDQVRDEAIRADSYVDGRETIIMTTTSSDATTKANTAESNANTYTDNKTSSVDSTRILALAGL